MLPVLFGAAARDLLQIEQQELGRRRRPYRYQFFRTDRSSVPLIERLALYCNGAPRNLHPGVVASPQPVRDVVARFQNRRVGYGNGSLTHIHEIGKHRYSDAAQT